MASVICVNCKAPCWYAGDNWWNCANGHGQKLDSVVPDEADKLQKQEDRVNGYDHEKGP